MRLLRWLPVLALLSVAIWLVLRNEEFEHPWVAVPLLGLLVAGLLAPALLGWVGLEPIGRRYGSRGRIERLEERLHAAPEPARAAIAPAPAPALDPEARLAVSRNLWRRRWRALFWELLLWTGAVIYPYAVVTRALDIGGVPSLVLIAFSPMPLMAMIYRHRDDRGAAQERRERRRARLQRRIGGSAQPSAGKSER